MSVLPELSKLPLPSRFPPASAEPPFEQFEFAQTVKVTAPDGTAFEPVTATESCTTDPIGASVITPCWALWMFVTTSGVSLFGVNGSHTPSAALYTPSPA